MTSGKHKRGSRSNKKNRHVHFNVPEGRHEGRTTTGTSEEKSKESRNSIPSGIVSHLHPSSSSSLPHFSPSTSPPPSDPEIRRENDGRSAKRDLFEANINLEETSVRQSIPLPVPSLSRPRPANKHTVVVCEPGMPQRSIDYFVTTGCGEKNDGAKLVAPAQKISSGITDSSPLKETAKRSEKRVAFISSPITSGEERDPPPSPPSPSSSLTSTSSSIPSIAKNAPPPPPLSPPGAPPPPPPPLPGTVTVSPSVREFKKERNTMSVQWEGVQSRHDNSLWSEHREADMSEGELEELQRSFGLQPKVTTPIRPTSSREKERPSAKLASPAYALSGDREKNIAIVLWGITAETGESYMSMLERLERDEIVEEGNIDALRRFLTIYPTENELAPFKPIPLEIVVGEANKFCWHLSRKPVLRIKAQLLIAKETLNADLKSVETSMATLEAGIGEARSDFIKDFLFEVLKYGNYLNQGTPHRRVVGFSISSLISVLNQRGPADAGGKRIVDVLAVIWKTKEDVTRLAEILSMASKMDDLTALEKSLRATKQSVVERKSELDSSEDTQLKEKYSTFIEDCDARCATLFETIKELRAKEVELRVYFACPSLSLKRIIEILAAALDLFKKSLDSRTEAEAKEDARNRRRTTSMVCRPRADLTLGVPAATPPRTHTRRQSLTEIDMRSVLSQMKNTVPPPSTVPSQSPTVTLPTIESTFEETEF